MQYQLSIFDIRKWLARIEKSVVDAELIVKKNRHGPTGTALCKFVKRTTHFVQNYGYGNYEAGTE